MRLRPERRGCRLSTPPYHVPLRDSRQEISRRRIRNVTSVGDNTGARWPTKLPREWLDRYSSLANEKQTPSAHRSLVPTQKL